MDEGKLTIPNDTFLALIEELDRIFDNFNGKGFNTGPGYLSSLINLATSVNVDQKIKALFFRCKTYFRIRIFNDSRKKNIHNNKLRKIVT